MTAPGSTSGSSTPLPRGRRPPIPVPSSSRLASSNGSPTTSGTVTFATGSSPRRVCASRYAPAPRISRTTRADQDAHPDLAAPGRARWAAGPRRAGWTRDHLRGTGARRQQRRRLDLLARDHAPQIVAELSCGLVSVRGVLRERSHHHGVEARRHVGVQRRRGQGCLLNVLVRDGHGGVAGERRLCRSSSRRARRRASRGPSARRPAGPAPARGRGTRRCRGPRRSASTVSGPATRRAMPKSITFTRPSRVTMMFAGLMSRWITPWAWAAASASATFSAISAALAGGEPAAAGEVLREGPALDVLHHDVVRLAVHAGVVDVDDVGVVEAGGGLGLAAEPLHEARVPGELWGQDLYGHRAVERGVEPSEDLGHTARADARLQAVAPSQHGLAHDCSIPLGPRLGPASLTTALHDNRERPRRTDLPG